MSDLSFPLLRTKLLRPQLAPALVARQRLLDMLLGRPDAALLLLVASAGSGKTTLINQFLEQRGWPAAWLSLDEGDDDLVVFLSYVAAAVENIFPGACELTQKLLRTPQPPPVDYLAATLINELSDIPQPFALVLDDYHSLRAAPIHQLTGQLLHHAPASLRLVISSRYDPPLPLSRLASRGRLVEIRAADLRFQPAEAQTLLERSAGLALPQKRVDALVEEMEGWAVGLHSGGSTRWWRRWRGGRWACTPSRSPCAAREIGPVRPATGRQETIAGWSAFWPTRCSLCSRLMCASSSCGRRCSTS